MDHTRGPWVWGEEALWSAKEDGTPDKTKKPVLVARGYYYHRALIDAYDADARLVAAAPDLLAALKRLKDAAEAVGRTLEARRAHSRKDAELAMAYLDARDAIAKATRAPQ